MAINQTQYSELFSPTSWHHQSGGPRYLQLQRHLESAIKNGHLPAEATLPAERELAAMTGLSRVTIRKAIGQLVEDGLVIQRRGSGSFVAPKVQRMEQSLSRLTSFTEDMQRRGMTSSSELLESGTYLPSPEEIVSLGLASGEQVVRIKRLRRADGIPMAVETSSLSSEFLPNPDDVVTSLYEVLSEQGIRPSRAIQRISACKLTQEQAELLEVAPGDAALYIDRTAYLPSGRVIELTTGVYRGDIYDFVAELRSA
ncbi:GntR family transcriptional regulator [Pseudovibrio japonicus]|uniref:GntR family transcriptional regulator n=1 Tax=Pseudovibrio japonicus TaxID=366534 RepID=UPI00167975E2|nr:GntR family transcriptional regulator [Pseudovibrio japonicus]